MAVTRTGTPDKDRATPSGSPVKHTWAYSVASDADLLVVGVAYYPGGGPITIDGVTYDSVPMMKAAEINNSTSVKVALYYLVNPSTGSNNVEVTYSSSPGTNESVIGAHCLKGVDTADPLNDTSVATGTSTAPTVDVDSATDEMVADVVGSFSVSNFSFGAGQTEEFDTADASGTTDHAGSTEAGAASVTMSWSKVGTERWAIAGASFKAAAAGGGLDIPIAMHHYKQMMGAN